MKRKRISKVPCEILEAQSKLLNEDFNAKLDKFMEDSFKIVCEGILHKTKRGWTAILYVHDTEFVTRRWPTMKAAVEAGNHAMNLLQWKMNEPWKRIG